MKREKFQALVAEKQTVIKKTVLNDAPHSGKRIIRFSESLRFIVLNIQLCNRCMSF